MSKMLTTKITTEAETLPMPDEKGDFAALPLAQRKVRPLHPGAVLRDLYLPPNLTQGELAARLGTSRRSVNMILNEQRPISVDMAHRLARLLGTSPRFWLGLQQSLDEWDARHEHEAEYARIQPLPQRELQTA